MSGDAAPFSVLVVDDDPISVLVLESMLAKMGCVSRSVGSGEAAIEAVSASRFDLVLLDWKLPGLSGVEVARRIRAHPRDASDSRGAMALVLVTGTPDASRVDEAAPLFDGHVSKPVRFDNLHSVILNRGRPRSAAATRVAEPTEDDERDLREGLAHLATLFPDEPARALALVETWRREGRRRVEAIAHAFDTGDTDTARREAHALKSSSRHVGALSVSRLAESIERGTGGQDRQAGAELLRCFERVSQMVAGIARDAFQGSGRAARAPVASRILLVDDSDTDRLLFRRSLERAGFLVEEAESAAQGLAACERSAPELVVLDGWLADGTGVELCRRLRGLPALARVPVVIVSGIDAAELRQPALAAGANAVLEKSSDWSTLVTVIRALLGREA